MFAHNTRNISVLFERRTEEKNELPHDLSMGANANCAPSIPCMCVFMKNFLIYIAIHNFYFIANNRYQKFSYSFCGCIALFWFTWLYEACVEARACVFGVVCCLFGRLVDRFFFVECLYFLIG